MADVVMDFLMKNKNADGSFTTLHPITKTSNVKTTEDIEVMLKNDIGSFKNGDTIDAGTSMDSIVRKLVQVQIAPSYTAPSASIKVSSGTAAGSYEIGTSISPTLSGSFTKNDAGELSKIVIKKNGTEVASATTSPVTHSETFVIESTVKFAATASYAAGAIKKDNFGADYPTGSIAAGDKTSSEISYTCYRKYFWGADNGTAAATTSANVRGLENSSTAAAANNTSFNVTIKKGQTRATFAYPASLRDVTSVKYVEFNNDESKNFFTKSTVKVEGADSYEGIDYKVYTYIPAQPFPSDMTFKVTI